MTALFAAVVLSSLFFGVEFVKKIDAYTLSREGFRLFQARAYEDAADAFGRSISSGGVNEKTVFALIRSLMELGEYEKALQHYRLLEECQAPAPRGGSSLTGEQFLALADIYYALDKMALARESLLKCLHDGYDPVGTSQRLAHVAIEVGNCEQFNTALTTLADSLANNPGNATAMALEKNLQSAMQNLNENPSALAYYKAGIAYKDLGQFANAVQMFAESAKQPDAPRDAFFWLGVDAELRGDRDEALRYYASATANGSTHYAALRARLRIQH